MKDHEIISRLGQVEGSIEAILKQLPYIRNRLLQLELQVLPEVEAKRCSFTDCDMEPKVHYRGTDWCVFHAKQLGFVPEGYGNAD